MIMETELVFKGESGNVLTDSVRVANTFLKEHRRVMQDIRDLTCSDEFRVHNFVQSSYLNSQNKEQPMYIMTEDGFTFLAMGYTGEKASEFKEKYINQFNLMKKKIEDDQHNKFPIPQTYSEALMLAANQAKQIEEQARQLDEQKPKVEFFDQVTDSKDAIDMGSCAKVLNMGIGRNRLFELLRNKGVLQRTNIPYQKYIDLGYFRTIEQKFSKPDGTNCINIKTVVYQKGMAFIRNIIAQNKKDK